MTRNFFVVQRCSAGVEEVALQTNAVGLSNLSFKGDVPKYEEIKL